MIMLCFNTSHTVNLINKYEIGRFEIYTKYKNGSTFVVEFQ